VCGVSIRGWTVMTASVLAYALAQLSTLSAEPTVAVAAIAALLALAVAVHLLAGVWSAVPDPAHRGMTLRDLARDRRLPRLLDPDAAGRPRPRAPTRHLG
jgi:succinate dehydrogenase/fumarate reductase cytochrome b subunit